MATSGSKSITVTSYDTLKFSWSESSQDITNNKTKISWKLQLISTSAGRIDSSVKKDWSVTVNGTKYSGTNYVSIANNTTKTLASGTTTISHNTDGTKTFSYSFSQEFAITFSGTYIGTKSGSGTGTLDTIPRKSTLSVANGTLNTAQTLTVTRNSTSFTHTITATCGSASTTICTKSTSTSISFTPPLSWASQNTTGTSVSVTYKITTYNGSTSLGTNSYTKTCSIPSSVKPSCKITVTESTSYGAYVKGLSKAKIVVTPTTSYGSAIASYSVSANGATYTTATVTTGVLSTAGTMTITATVKDKRGRTGTATATITVSDKSTLTVSNGTLGTEQTVSITKGHSGFKHIIEFFCGDDKQGYILGDRDTGTLSTASSAKWTPELPLAEENKSGTTISCSVILYTYTSNGTEVGETSKTITLTIPSSVKPSCSVSVTDAMGYASKYGAYVKGYSKFKVAVTPTLAYGSAIASYNVTANGVTYTSASFTTDVLSSYGTLTVSATVKDKRGRSGSDSEPLTVLNYSAPNISTLKVKRCDEDGTENPQGAYVQVTFSASVTALNDKNTATYKLEYKKTTESSYTVIALSDYADNYSVSNATYIFEADTGSSYNVRMTASDDLGNATKTTVASTGFTLMHWHTTGRGMAIGKVSELEDYLDVGFMTRFRNIIFADKSVLTGGKTAYNDGKIGALISESGNVHLQHETQASVRFYTGGETTDSGRIYVNTSNVMYFEGSTRYAFSANIALGLTASSLSTLYMYAPYADNSLHGIVTKSSDGLTSQFGWAGSSSYSTITTIAGRTCKYTNSSGTTTLSDVRMKKDFTELDKWSAFFDALEPCAFRMKGGNSGRYHMGFKAQQVEQALLDSGLSTQDFAGFIKMKYTPNEDDAEGNAVYEVAGIKAGEDEYGLIYTEFIAQLVYEVQKLKAEVKALKQNGV